MGTVTTNGGTLTQIDDLSCATIYTATQALIASRTGTYPSWLNGGTCSTDPMVTGSYLIWPDGGTGFTVTNTSGQFTGTGTGTNTNNGNGNGTGTGTGTGTTTGTLTVGTATLSISTVTMTVSPYRAGSDEYNALLTLVGAAILVAVAIVSVKALIHIFNKSAEH